MHMSIFPLTIMHTLVTWIHVLVTLLKLNYSYTATTTTHVLLPFFPKNLLWCWLAIWCLYDASILLLLLPFYLLLCHWIWATTLNWILPHDAGALLSTHFYFLWLLLAAVVHFSLTVHFLLFCGLMQLLNSLSLAVWICGALLYTLFSLLWLLLFYFTRYVPTAYCSYTLLHSFAGSILVDQFEMAEGLSPLATKAFTWLPSSSPTISTPLLLLY